MKTPTIRTVVPTNNPIRRVDLHIHSSFSDGTWSPSEIVNQALQASLDVITITDHDTLEGVAEGAVAAQKAGIGFVTGVEVSTTIESYFWHILGLGFDVDAKSIKNLLNKNQLQRQEFEQEAFEAIIGKNWSSQNDNYLQYQHQPERGGWKLLNWCIDNQYVKDINDFFKQLEQKLGRIQPTCVHPLEALEAIQQANGRAILAHPMYEKRPMSLSEILNMFKDFGFDGIECFHPHHSAETAAECLQFCKNNQLIATSGSDYHGTFAPKRILGMHQVTAQELNLHFES